MHTHIGYYYGEKNADRLAEDRMLRAYFIGKRMEDTLKAGVTTIRDTVSYTHLDVYKRQSYS